MFTLLNGKIVSLGTSTALGELNGTGTKTLADDITNYSFIHIRVGYYASGYANYGSITIPVSCITFTTDTTYDYAINCLSGTTPGKVFIGFNNKNTLRVTSTTYNYVVVKGIK